MNVLSTIVLALLALFLALLFIGVLLTLVVRARRAISRRRQRPHIAVIRVVGDICDDDSRSSPESVEKTTPDGFARAFDEATRAHGARAIVLEINSPGGSGSAAYEIAQRIWRFREQPSKARKPVYAVIRAYGTSAAYWIVSACERIYTNPVALVGSIGVRQDRLGFLGLAQRLGVELRTQTAGHAKILGHPLLEDTPEGRAHFQDNLEQQHEVFQAFIRKGRSTKLGEDDELFSGKAWTGREAIRRGLADMEGDLRTVQDEHGGPEASPLLYYDEPVPARFVLPREVTIHHRHSIEDLFG